jgi:AmiR/NasT family two-component response regulator
MVLVAAPDYETTATPCRGHLPGEPGGRQPAGGRDGTDPDRLVRCAVSDAVAVRILGLRRTTMAFVTDNEEKKSMLPLDLPPLLEPVETPEEEPAAPPARKVRRAVVAEDEALIRMDVVETLREAGFDVVGEAGDGETAVRLALELKPDVVVMDVKMPELDGISAAERIGKAHVAPVVLLTAFSQTELVERARDAGAMAYVVKPFSPADLLPAVEIAISRYSQISALEAEVADLAERFETRKRVDRAKGLLMSKMGLSEPESFRWIQKTSMDRRLTMREVADAVIDQVGDN